MTGTVQAPPFVLGLLRGRPAPEALPSESDTAGWLRIETEARRHGLTYLLAGWLKQPGNPLVPQPFTQAVKAHLARQTAHAMILARELVTILTRLEQHRVRCLPLRGLALAEQLYGEHTARPTGDIDLLVPKDSLTTTAVVLHELGYHEVDRRPGFARAYSYTLEFIKRGPGWITVEPHWTLAYPPYVDRLQMAPIWARCRRTTVLDRPTWRLDPADLVLHLSWHIVHRAPDVPLSWYWELDRLIRQDTIDWSIVARQAEASGFAPLLIDVIEALRPLLDTPIPASTLVALRAAAPPRTFIGRRIPGLLAQASVIDGAESLAVFLCMKGIRRRLSYAWGLIVPSAQFIRLEYGLPPHASVSRCYLRRLSFLLHEGLKALVVLLSQRFLARSG